MLLRSPAARNNAEALSPRRSSRRRSAGAGEEALRETTALNDEAQPCLVRLQGRKRTLGGGGGTGMSTASITWIRPLVHS